MKIKNIFKHDQDTKIWFMSDLHYNHSNVISLDSRNFKDIKEMNNYICSELITKVKDDDIIFDLGDMFWGMNTTDIKDVLDLIPTKNIYKIVGNHDKASMFYDFENHPAKLKNCFVKICDILDIQVEYNNETYMVNLSHTPQIDFNHMYHGGLHLFGHTHGHLDKFVNTIPYLMVDVGFSASLSNEVGSFLIPFDKILEHFYKKTGGMNFKKWAGLKYHSKDALWSEK